MILGAENLLFGLILIMAAATVTLLLVIGIVVGLFILRSEKRNALKLIVACSAGLTLEVLFVMWTSRPYQPPTTPMVKSWDFSTSHSVASLGNADQRGKPTRVDRVFDFPTDLSDRYSYEGAIALSIRLPGGRVICGRASEVYVSVDAKTQEIDWLSASLGPFESTRDAYREHRAIIENFGASGSVTRQSLVTLERWHKRPRLETIDLTPGRGLPSASIELFDYSDWSKLYIRWF